MQERAFLMVSGLSPQIVTETLYAHYVTYKLDPGIPSQVHLITTMEGANRARLSLLQGASWFSRLVDEYDIQNLSFPEANISIITDADGKPLNDIRSEEDNAAAANFITAYIQQLTHRDDLELHVSLAGGRKTMGYYIGYALSLFGRPQDSLSHVLVSEGFENNPQFYFPSRETRVIYDRDERPLDTSKAEVTLARIPFVLMRDELPAASLVNQVSFSEAVEQLNSQAQEPRLTLDLRQRQVLCNGRRIENLTSSEYLFYIWFVARHLNDDDPLHPLVEGEYQKSWGDSFLKLMKHLNEYRRLQERTIQTCQNGIDNNLLANKRSSIAAKMKEKLGQKLAERFTLNTVNHPSQGRFFTLELKEEQIEIIGGDLRYQQ